MYKEKLEEAAKKYSTERFFENDGDVSKVREISFESGANWALQNQWHDVSNDLPYKDKTLVDGHTTRDLLCISDKNEAYIDFMELLKFGGKWHWFRKNIHKCKYWMPIPRRN